MTNTTESTAVGSNINPTENKFTNWLSHVLADLGKNGIFIALIVVVLLFSVLTNGILLRPQNISNLVVQNGYILVLAIGMVMVIIAGHIDLSVGSVAAFVGACSGVFAVNWGLPWWLAVVLSLAHRRAGRRVAGLLGRLCRHPGLHRDPRRHAHLPRARPGGAGQREHRQLPRGVPRPRERVHHRLVRRNRSRPVHARRRGRGDRAADRAAAAHAQPAAPSTARRSSRSPGS